MDVPTAGFAMATAMPEEPQCSYHPVFNSPDADCILRSTEGTLYRIPSFTLKNTSGFFRTMLSLPQGGKVPENDPIPISEKDVVLERVLRMICGFEIPKWESFDQVEEVLSLAELWDTPGPLSIIRSAITAPLFLQDPLRLYAIATHFEWEQEANLASTYTLRLSLYDDKYQTVLHRLSSKHLLALLTFHRKRRDMFQRYMDSEQFFNVGNLNPYHCRGCNQLLDNRTWYDLKARIFMEMDKRPLGDFLFGLEMEQWPESVACWNAKCSAASCGRLNYERITTLKEIQRGFYNPPLTIHNEAIDEEYARQHLAGFR